MPDRFDRRMSSGQGGHPGSQRGSGQGARGQYTANSLYGSNGGPVYGHHGPGQPGKTGGQGALGAEYGHGGGHYGQGGYLMGYGGQAGRLAREIETMSASSGSVNARRRNRGNLEQVAEGESSDSRAEEENRSLTRRNERHRTNSRIGQTI